MKKILYIIVTAIMWYFIIGFVSVTIISLFSKELHEQLPAPLTIFFIFIAFLLYWVWYKMHKNYLKTFPKQLKSGTSLLEKTKKIEENKILYGFTKKEFNKMKETLTQNWTLKYGKKTIPFDNDVYWALANDLIMKSSISGNKQKYELAKYIQNQILQSEKKPKTDTNALTKQEYISKLKIDYLKELDKKFSKSYLDTMLDDEETIREHMLNDYAEQSYHNSEHSKQNFPKEIDQQYEYVIENMENRSDKYINMTPEEELIIKTFLEKVSKVRQSYNIHLIRHSNGMIRIEYNGYPTGQFNLRNENYIRILRGMQIKDLDDVTFEEMLKALDSWVRYCKYQLKESKYWR